MNVTYALYAFCVLFLLIDSHGFLPSDSNSANQSTSASRSLQTSTTITLIIKFDCCPEETSWDLRRADGSEVDSRQPGFYTEPRSHAVHHIDVVKGTTYIFTIFDKADDGTMGYIELVSGTSNLFDYSPSNLIARIDNFTAIQQSVKFTARVPFSSTPGPTAPPASPTPAPTACNPTLNMSAAVDPFTKNPVFTTPLFEFGAAETFCSSHNNYADCTNESREDCQWIFLTQSKRMGKCRVDPIAKCLQTGDCVCNTEDFHGGTSKGILFHVPISITARDISSNSELLTYTEFYEFPSVQNPKHPQDDTFFISKVDFTGRQLRYEFADANPTVTASSKTVYFKLHYLYTDVPLVGSLWNGLGLEVTIDTSAKTHVININGRAYNLPRKLKIWTCTQIAISADTLFVAGVPISRVISQETSPPLDSSSLLLGPFSGEMFDVRVYSGKSSRSQVYEVGARCAGPNDPATIKKKEDIETFFLHQTCDSDQPFTYGLIPPGGIQTYGSGAFATLWLNPVKDPLNEGQLLNIPEGHFDEEHYFQHAKLQSYQWERHYFENDMIGFVLKPYRMFKVDEVPPWSAKTFNNPCRYIHQNNNYWSFPLYSEEFIPKWTVEYYAQQYGGSPDAVFDLGMLYKNHGFDSYHFVTHELFHEIHYTLGETYNGKSSGWLQESVTESATTLLFPGVSRVIIAGVALAPAWPLSFEEKYASSQAAAMNPHIFSKTLSLDDDVRGSHYYGTWVLWWFLSQHAGLPHILGQMFSVDEHIQAYWHGKLFVLRLLLHSNDIDLGDAWITFVSHYRTWDFKNGKIFQETEQTDFQSLAKLIALPSSVTLESRKTNARINPSTGTNGIFVLGPSVFRPSPFSWNCLTASNVAAGKVIGITIRWDDGMGFDANVNTPEIIEQHSGCDNDVRFYNGMAVLYNAMSGERRYWKIKGKSPSTLYINTGANGPVTLHILLMPTPPVDYSGGRNVAGDVMVAPLPIYSYRYKVDILDSVPNGASVSNPASKVYGIVKFDSSTAQGWFSAKCSCLDNPDDPDFGVVCLDPTFKGATPSPSPPVICFSGDSLVTVENRGPVTMTELQLGDRVLVGRTYEPVYSFGHRLRSCVAEYLSILPFKLEVSKDHMVFVEGGAAVPASTLKVGDRLENGERITAIRRVDRAGAYAPFTPSGSIVVNGVRASSFIAFQDSSHLKVGSFVSPLSYQWLAHTFEAPHRIWCVHLGASSCLKERYTDAGMSVWVKVPFDVATWLLDQHALIVAVVLVPLVGLSVLCVAVETIIAGSLLAGSVLSLVLVTLVFVRWRPSRRGLSWTLLGAR